MFDITIASIVNALGVIIGVTGTIINISTRLNLKKRVFIFWVISDFLLIVWAFLTYEFWLLAMYSIYLVIALAGLYNTQRVLSQRG